MADLHYIGEPVFVEHQNGDWHMGKITDVEMEMALGGGHFTSSVYVEYTMPSGAKMGHWCPVGRGYQSERPQVRLV